MGRNVKLDPRGMEEAATSSEARREIAALAEQVAGNVRAQGRRVEGEPGDIPLPVNVTVGVTTNMRINRAKAWISLAHQSGEAEQAKNGTLTKAAAQAGLKVKGKGR